MTDQPRLPREVVDSLFAPDLAEVGHWEELYPPRELPEGAHVTRFAPSPTGYVHIGGIYTAMICQSVSLVSDGVFITRVEDTDTAREVHDALEQFARAFAYFRIDPDETDPAVAPGKDGRYGPYRQSRREQLYHSYARHMLREGRAYVDFATREQLADITARQQAAKIAPGYYGGWSLWREAPIDTVLAELERGTPYVVRFRAPDLPPGARSTYVDVIRGRLEHEANRNDVVILKSSDTSPRLPTYHFAHAVDDHLMRVDLVIRAEEWISSVPLHLQLFETLGFEAPAYAHVAPLMKQIPGGKRKLSKRKDAEAGADYYVEQGYPADAVLYYLRGLANGRLAELPIAQALAEPIRLSECGVAGPLVDLVKLEDISGDVIASWSSEKVVDAVRGWARQFDPAIAEALDADPISRCVPSPWSASASTTRARTCASGRTSAAPTASSSRRCSPRSAPRTTSASPRWASRPTSSGPSWGPSPTGTGRWTTATRGSPRSASWPPSRVSRPRRRSSRRTPRRTRGRSARRPSSSGSRSPGRRAAPTCPTLRARSAPPRSCAACAPSGRASAERRPRAGRRARSATCSSRGRRASRPGRGRGTRACAATGSARAVAPTVRLRRRRWSMRGCSRLQPRGAVRRGSPSPSGYPRLARRASRRSRPDVTAGSSCSAR